MRINSLIVAAAVLISAASYGADSAGTAGMQFLKIGVDARGNALAGAVIAEKDGLASLFWNPAGLNGLNGGSALMTYNRWIADMNFIYASFGIPLAKLGRIAGSATFLGEGSLDQIKQDLAAFGGTGSFDLCFSAGYSTRLGAWDAGGAVRFITKNVFGRQSSGIVLDAGVQVAAISGLRLGAAVRNIGFASPIGVMMEKLPLMGLAGGTYTFQKERHQLKTMLALELMLDDSPFVDLGLEYGWSKILFLRAGYRVSTAKNSLNALKGLSLGFGGSFSLPAVSRISTDIAWLPMGELGQSLQVSLGFKF